MSLVCPKCKFRRSAEAGVRLEVCPRCEAMGREAYLSRPSRGSARHPLDLIDLTSTARKELARARRL